MWHLIADGYPVVKFTFGENLRPLTIFLNLDGKIHANIRVYQANNRTGRVFVCDRCSEGIRDALIINVCHLNIGYRFSQIGRIDKISFCLSSSLTGRDGLLLWENASI